jgi:hypothetical protein
MAIASAATHRALLLLLLLLLLSAAAAPSAAPVLACHCGSPARAAVTASATADWWLPGPAGQQQGNRAAASPHLTSPHLTGNTANASMKQQQHCCAPPNTCGQHLDAQMPHGAFADVFSNMSKPTIATQSTTPSRAVSKVPPQQLTCPGRRCHQCCQYSTAPPLQQVCQVRPQLPQHIRHLLQHVKVTTARPGHMGRSHGQVTQMEKNHTTRTVHWLNM